MPQSPPRPVSLLAAGTFAVALAALLVVALFPVFPQRLDIRVNDTASRTVRAPRTVSFESEFLTDQRRQAAADAVPPAQVYDDEVRDAQLAEWDRLAGEVTQARSLADDARKRESLGRLPLSQRSIEAAITLPDDRWAAVSTEGRRVLAETLGVSLDSAAATQAKDAVDSLVSPAFTADQAVLTAELARPLIVPTLVVDEERTQQARDAARAAVPPELVTVQKGDVILSADSRVDEVAIEKLRAAGLLSRTVEWRNVVAVAVIASVAALAAAGYVYLLQPRGISSERHLIALAVVAMLPLLVAKFYIPAMLPDEGRHFLAYALPVAAGPLLIAALLNTEVAVLVGAVTGVLVAMLSAMLPDVSLVASVGALDALRLLLVYGMAPLAGVLLMHRADRLNRYLGAGGLVAAASFALLLAVWFIDSDRTVEDIGWMALASGFGGLSAGLLAAGAFVSTGVIFGVTTRVQLMELSQLNAPLLRRLQDEAPGTFHHSVIVGNLAERAADLVGGDPLLVRVGCYYHDIGKVLQPGLYIENQQGESPHENMTPEESARAIKEHVSGGLSLARRARLPARVQSFIPEHHGTRLVAYFYRKAAETEPSLDPAAFQYPGPRPQSKETAIVMLADSTEAVVRAAEDRSPERIDAMVDEVIAERMAEGQLDECELTLRDIRIIADSFKSTMRAVYHPRVAYPEPAPMEARWRMLRFPLRAPSGDPAQVRRRGERRRTR